MNNSDSTGFAKKAADLKAKLRRMGTNGNEIKVPVMGGGGETVWITKPKNTSAANGKKAAQVSKLGLSYEDTVVYKTSRDQDVAIFLGQGFDSASGKTQNWFFSQSNESGATGAIFFAGLEEADQLAQYRVRKMSI